MLKEQGYLFDDADLGNWGTNVEAVLNSLDSQRSGLLDPDTGLLTPEQEEFLNTTWYEIRRRAGACDGISMLADVLMDYTAPGLEWNRGELVRVGKIERPKVRNSHYVISACGCATVRFSSKLYEDHSEIEWWGLWNGVEVAHSDNPQEPVTLGAMIAAAKSSYEHANRPRGVIPSDFNTEGEKQAALKLNAAVMEAEPLEGDHEQLLKVTTWLIRQFMPEESLVSSRWRTCLANFLEFIQGVALWNSQEVPHGVGSVYQEFKSDGVPAALFQQVRRDLEYVKQQLQEHAANFSGKDTFLRVWESALKPHTERCPHCGAVVGAPESDFPDTCPDCEAVLYRTLPREGLVHVLKSLCLDLGSGYTDKLTRTWFDFWEQDLLRAGLLTQDEARNYRKLGVR